jgi:hypothetical protein
MTPEQELDQLFVRYREACPDIETGPEFLPAVWQRIESRRGFWPAFEHLARFALTMCAFACLLFALLDFTGERHSMFNEQTYVDALAADQSSEATFYADAMHANPTPFENVPAENSR